MFRKLLPLIFAAFAVGAYGQTSISASDVADSFGHRIPAARLCFQPVNATGAVTGFRVGSVQVIPTEACGNVVAGTLAGGLSVESSPTGSAYHVYVKSYSSEKILRDFCTIAITGSSWTLDTLDCPTAGPVPTSGIVTTVNGNSGAFDLTGSDVSCAVVSGVYTCTVSGGATILSTTQMLAGDGSGGVVASHMDDGYTTAGRITSTEPVSTASGTSNVPPIMGTNTGADPNSVNPGDFLCPNTPAYTSSTSGCALNVGLANTNSNGLVASFGWLNMGSGSTNLGFLGMGTASGTPTTHAFRWNLKGDSFFPQLPSVGCLGTDSAGKLGAGSGCGGGLSYPSAGLAASTGLAWRTPVFGDVVALWASGACLSGYLKFDGTCSNPSGGGGSAYNVTPSGDTTCATDRTAIQALITAGTSVILAPGTYYADGLTMSAAPGVSIIGTGPATTIFNMCSATARFLAVTYTQTEPTVAGGIVRGFAIQPKSGVTPTAGGGILLGTGSGGNYTNGMHFEDIHMQGLWGGFHLQTGVAKAWIKDDKVDSSVSGGEGGIYYDVPSPGGDLHITSVELHGDHTGVTMAHCDTGSMTDIKVNGNPGFVFTGSGICENFRIINPSIESDTTLACGIDFGTGTTVSAPQIIGGGIGVNITNALCNTGHTSNLAYAFNDYTISDPNGWNTNLPASSLNAVSALPNGTTATTQTVGDSTSKVATDAFVLANPPSLSAVTPGSTGSGTYDFSAATQVKLPVSAGFASLANGECGYDSTNKNWHCWVNGADTFMIPLASGFTSGHCGQPTLTGATWSIQDAGGACGVSGGGAAFSAITTGSNTTATMTVGTGASIVRSGSGTVDANQINSATVPVSSGNFTTNSSGQFVAGGSSIPPSIPNLYFWFSADRMPSIDGAAVLRWFDTSTSTIASNAGFVAGPVYHTNVVNSQPAATYGGSSATRATLNPPASLTAFTIFVVFNPTSTASDQYFVAGTSGAPALTLKGTTGKLQIGKDGVTGICDDTTVLSTSTWYQFNATYNSSGGACAFRVNEVAGYSGANAVSFTSPVSLLGYEGVGPSGDLNGKLAEIMVYTRALTGPEITTLETYLHSKYGI